VLGCDLPAFCSQELELDKQQLYELVADRDLLFTALQAAHKPFQRLNGLESGGGDFAASTVERAWDSVLSALCSQCCWLPPGQDYKGDLDLTRTAQQPVRHKLQVATSLFHYVSKFEGPSNHTGKLPNMPLLGWSTVLFNKPMRIQSVSDRRPKYVLLQVFHIR